MPLRDIVTRDLGWKLFSVALAVAVWLTVQAISKDRGLSQSLGPWENHTFTNLPVLVVSAAADVREFKVQPAAIGVTVRGRPEVISALTEKEIEVRVDLTDVESARSLRKRVMVSVPPGVILVRTTPSEVDVVVPPKKSN